MKQKKIDKVIEEYRKNGNKNLEAKFLLGSISYSWEPSVAFTEDQVLSNIEEGRYKYRIKKSDITKLTIEQTNEVFEEFNKILDRKTVKTSAPTLDKKPPTGNCVMFLEDINSVLEQFDKDGNSDNLEVLLTRNWEQSSVLRRNILETNMKARGIPYRIKPGIASTNQSPIMPPIILKNGDKIVEASVNYPGDYYISASIYFKSKKDGETWLNFIKKFEVDM